MDKSDQLKKLKDEVDQYQKEYKKKREGYEKRVGIINHMLSCMPTLTTLLIGLSCIPGFWETSFKVAGIVCFGVCYYFESCGKEQQLWGEAFTERDYLFCSL